jgi:hypothetical protein
MELDINAYWTSFITYQRPGAIGAANLLLSMDRSPQRYLTPDDRDFLRRKCSVKARRAPRS